MIIDERVDGLRIDVAINKINEKISISHAKELINKGKILLDGKVVKVSTIQKPRGVSPTRSDGSRSFILIIKKFF